ncbi:MAG: RsmD family RNA methyltransferase [Planctomycetia bacterium]|nr:RsmD family RNA methyltransferase [Planctomycetia bacterium]
MVAKKYRKPSEEVDSVGLRIIGGKFRGRKLAYAGDRRVRPMKDRVREATFNLIHRYVPGSYVLDLFGGTGALGLEAISRGAIGCTFTEQHFPTARIIQQNITTLGVEAQTQLWVGDVFLTYQKEPDLPVAHPWLVFCSPPYRFFKERTETLCQLLARLYFRAPAGSVFVAESDTTFDWHAFDDLGPWEIRTYPPAVLGIHRKEETP